MPTIDEQDERLLLDVTKSLDKNELNITEFARRRDRIRGSPNVVDNFVVPACSLIFGRGPTFGSPDKSGGHISLTGHELEEPV